MPKNNLIFDSLLKDSKFKEVNKHWVHNNLSVRLGAGFPIECSISFKQKASKRLVSEICLLF